MRRLPSLAAAVLGIAVLAGCATTMTVSSHLRPDTDFSQYRTYAWGPADALPTGDARLDANPFFKDHLQGAVEKRLAVRGFELAPAGTTPGLLLHYHAAISQRIDVSALDQDLGSCTNCEVTAVPFEAGTIVLDVIDGRDNRLVWRGWAQTRVEDMLRSQDTMAKQIGEAAVRMLDRLPRAAALASSSSKGGRQ